MSPTDQLNKLKIAQGFVHDILLAPIYDIAVQTNVDRLKSMSARLQNDVFVKREDEQPVHSFKLRGAYNKLAHLTQAQLDCGVVAASAGNHAQGLALSAKTLGVNATIVMPETTPEIKVNAVRGHGANVVLVGKSFDEANKFALNLATEKSMSYIHPFDDHYVIAGQGTVAKELLQQVRDLDAIFIPVGGGGLLAGMAVYIKQLKPEINVIGVEPEGAACLKAALEAGKPVDLEQVDIFADGVAVKRIGEKTFELAQQYCDEVVTVNSDEMCAAIKDLFDDLRAVAEPAGALSLAGLKKYVKQNGITGKRLSCVLSGANLNFDKLRYVAERTELGEKKEAVIAVTIPERQGAFIEFCDVIGGKAITEFNYRFQDKSQAQIFVGVKLTNGQEELDQIIQQLTNAGYQVINLTDNELAKLHVRHMVGGKPIEAVNERIFSFEFPEYPGALSKFLNTLGQNWNITLFHYRNHGAAFGQVLAAFETTKADDEKLQQHLDELGFNWKDETENPSFKLFLQSS
ncbi:L-threonine dehydratase [Psychrosphaera saromensis]|uniref:L-threonine dehydratase n=1 Tax=Psychrosphaera saromensis TaxID=716813 RepID=A0A2S7USI4_9GAMM|nr:threonine ammonia-lyase, biosynthetic [Psychrosphaera saromensis]PQJ52705.1 threonine ammonia-lyase, biosynthetic [Psychrosphaera saromensis]GHB70585.1 L-threonine dehydratase [Psychrosphaera saromensis]GLQ13190.1 L-threonine dehydratase [Psychrosphaera saromensis]